MASSNIPTITINDLTTPAYAASKSHTAPPPPAPSPVPTKMSNPSQPQSRPQPPPLSTPSPEPQPYQECYLCNETNPPDFSPTTRFLQTCLLCTRPFCPLHLAQSTSTTEVISPSDPVTSPHSDSTFNIDAALQQQREAAVAAGGNGTRTRAKSGSEEAIVAPPAADLPVCAINHSTYFHTHPQLHGRIYPSIGEREKALFACKDTASAAFASTEHAAPSASASGSASAGPAQVGPREVGNPAVAAVAGAPSALGPTGHGPSVLGHGRSLSSVARALDLTEEEKAANIEEREWVGADIAV